MWNNKQSIILSRVCVFIFIALVISSILVSFPLIKWIIYISNDITLQHLELFITSYYICSVIALIALIMLNNILKNIYNELIFIYPNVKAIRICSWCCFTVSAITLINSFYYILFILLSIGFAFIGLLLRIIKNIFHQAIILKNENELTI